MNKLTCGIWIGKKENTQFAKIIVMFILTIFVIKNVDSERIKQYSKNI